MAMANTDGGKQTPKKLTADQKKLVKVVKRIGAVDKKPTTVESGNKSGLQAKAIKAAIAAKKPTAMSQSASSHQKDLAKISGSTAAKKKFAEDKKKGLMAREDKPSPSFVAGKKAEKKTLKSFGKSK